MADVGALLLSLYFTGDPGEKGDKGNKGEDGVGIKGSSGAPGKLTFLFLY